MGPENGFDPNSFTLFLGDTPVARGEMILPEITFAPETLERETKEPEMPPACEHIQFTITFKTPKRWRCRSRKRFIKLIMSEGISRNYAERLADFVRGWMPYGDAWRRYLWSKPGAGL